MNKTLYVIVLIVAMGYLCQLFADDVVINSFPHQESFESAGYPPDGWERRVNFGDPNLERVTKDPENPTAFDTPYGNNWVRLQPKPEADRNWAALVSPRIDFPAGDGYYRLKVSIYITGNTNSNVLIERMMQLWGGDSYEIGYMHNNRFDTPVGWYEYSFSLGFVGGTSQYIALSANCLQEDINIDNITIEEGSPWNFRAPWDGSTNVELNPWIWLSDYYVSTNTYSVYISTDAINYTLMYEGVYCGTDFIDPLLPDTTYYWYIVANEYGHTVYSPVWTFTTISAPPDLPTEIVYDFPYLADYQLDIPSWITVPMGKSAKSADLSAVGFNMNNTPLQNNADMSKYEPGLWVRTLDGEANIAWKLEANVTSAIVGPSYHLIAGQTYEIKYNYRQAEQSATPEEEGIFIMSNPPFSDNYTPDINMGMTNTDYALRMFTLTPEITADYMFAFVGFSTVALYFDNFRITQNGDDLLTAAAPTVDGVATPNPPPIYNTETLLPLDTDLHIANITGTPEVTATVSWAAPAAGSQNTGLRLNLHASEGTLAGATVTFIHNLGYAPVSASYRIVPNSFSTIYNPNDGSWTASQCIFTVPAGKADGDYEVILKLNDEETLPVELSSFTAIATSDYFVNLQWITQTETNLSGYYIYRNTQETLHNALRVSDIIAGTNSSQSTYYEFTDSEVETGNTYYYWLQSIDLDGTINYHGPISVILGNPNDHNDTPVVPNSTRLLSVYPNPFNPVTTIPYQLTTPETVHLSIYNSKGQLVKSYTKKHDTGGTFSIRFDGKDSHNKALANGIYHCVMKAGLYSASTKMVLLK
jgi:hypothetical protein